MICPRPITRARTAPPHQGRVLPGMSVGGAFPSMMLDARANLHVVYYENEDRSLRYLHSDQSRWRDVEVLTDVGSLGYLDPHLVYVQSMGTGWSTPQIVVDHPGSDLEDTTGVEPQATLDSEGTLHVLYQDSKENELRHVQRTQDGRWSEPALVGVSTGFSSSSPVLVRDDRGRMSVLYFDGDDKLRLAAYDGQQWMSVTAFEGAFESSRGWTLALDRLQRRHLLYLEPAADAFSYRFFEPSNP